jgi:NADH-quinone oxidoreductase subunit C
MSLEKTLSQIEGSFSDYVLGLAEYAGEQIIHIKGQGVIDVLKTFKDAGFNFLADLTAIDNLTLGGFERFAVVYHLLSHGSAERVTIKAYVPEDNPVLPSIELLWKTADWQEREVFDLFGIEFEGHPNLTRIMNPDDYEGHPLRKDYPRLGRKERYDFPVIDRGIQKQKRTE